jgi:transcriptional regulator with XRE-family HTH domain
LKSIHLSAYRQFQGSLVEIRQSAGITQAELARKLGRPQSYISKVESGDRRIDVVEYVQLMQAIGASPEPLIVKLATSLENSRNRRSLG